MLGTMRRALGGRRNGERRSMGTAFRMPLSLLCAASFASGGVTAPCVQDRTVALESSSSVRADGPVLDERSARHLWNRLGFGARPGELDAAVGQRAGEIFDAWVARSRAPLPMDLVLIRWEDYGCDRNGNEVPAPMLATLSAEERGTHLKVARSVDKLQFRKYLDDWIGGAIDGRDPVRDRMALFWHGYFPTNVRATLRRYELIRQHEFLRIHALGSFRDLLHGIVRDPAFLSFFDNDSSRADHPNENLARELLELYALGQGNYDERDVREAARALTGFQGASGFFRFDADIHDRGEKRIHARTGHFDGDDLVEILLEHPACARHVSRRLLAWMEGVEPEPERLERYARRLLDLEYELLPWLRSLATDPDFYRDEVVGRRVMGPIELLISTARRLEYRPDPGFVFFAGEHLGQLLYSPPTVKGWDEGEGWITGELLLRRDHCLGLLTGVPAVQPKPDAAPDQLAFLKELYDLTFARNLDPIDLRASVGAALGSDTDDQALIEFALRAWMPRQADGRARAEARQRWDRLRVAHAPGEDPWHEQEGAEELLRRFAHALLASPLAQFH